MLCKFENVRDDLIDTVANFKLCSNEVIQSIAITVDILGYIDLKCEDTVLLLYHNRLAEVRRDCSIYFSRLAKLNESLNSLLSLFQNAIAKFSISTPVNELECLFNSLVEKYLHWHKQYTDFKQSLKLSKEKWYSYENIILETIK